MNNEYNNEIQADSNYLLQKNMIKNIIRVH